MMIGGYLYHYGIALLLAVSTLFVSTSNTRAFSFEKSGNDIKLPDIASFIQSQLLNPNASPEVLEDYHALAQEMFDAGLYKDAEECYRFSLSTFDENNLAIKERLSATLRKEGRLIEAADELYDVIQHVQEPAIQSSLYLDLGSLIEEITPLPNTGPDWEDAIPYISVGKKSISTLDCYRFAVEQYPQNGEARKRLADTYAILGLQQDALVEFEKAALLLPNDVCCATHVHYDTQKGRKMPPLPIESRKSEREHEALELRHLCAPDDDPDNCARAFERDGVLVFPSFATDEQCTTLQGIVKDILDSSADGKTIDFSSETREPSFRIHKSIPVEKNLSVLNDLLTRLRPTLCRILQAEETTNLPLLGNGFMKIHPKATAQKLHKDVHHYDRHFAVDNFFTKDGGKPRTLSIQIQLSDTVTRQKIAKRGSLEVLPGSHRPDATAGSPSTIRKAMDKNVGVVDIDVPKGTLTIYSSRLWHRGGANESKDSRTFCFVTVSEPYAPAPPGLIHTMHMEDVGKWVISSHGIGKV